MIATTAPDEQTSVGSLLTPEARLEGIMKETAERAASAILGIDDSMIAEIGIPGRPFGPPHSFVSMDHFRIGPVFSKIGVEFERVFLGEDFKILAVEDNQRKCRLSPYQRHDHKQARAWDIELCLKQKNAEPLNVAALYRLLQSNLPSTTVTLNNPNGGNIFWVVVPGRFPCRFLVGAFPHQQKWAVEVLHVEVETPLPLRPTVIWLAR